MTNSFSRGMPLALPLQPGHAVAQLPVVHVDRARPGHRRRIDVERVAVVDRRVERRRQQVVRRRHAVEVAVEVEVDLLHRLDHRLAAAGAAALHAEHRAHRRLAQAEHHLLVDASEPLRQRDARRRLAFTGLGRRDRGDDDELAVGLAGEAAQQRQFHLGAELAEHLELVGLDAGRGGDVGNRAQLYLGCVGHYTHALSLLSI